MSQKLIFFTAIAALMQDKDSIEFKIQKTGDELTVLIIPKFEGKTTTINMSGLPEEFEELFMDELNKNRVIKREFTSNAETVGIDEVEDDKPTTAAPKAPAEKKTPAKKEAVKEIKKIMPLPPPLTDEAVNYEEEKAKLKAEKDKEEAEAKAKADAEATQKKAIQEEFKAAMALGKESFVARRYEDSESAYKKAVSLMPGNADAERELKNSIRWVNQLIEAGVIEPRKEDPNGA